MSNLASQPLARLLESFDPGVTIEDVERMVQSGVLSPEQAPVAEELMRRAQRMSGVSIPRPDVVAG